MLIGPPLCGAVITTYITRLQAKFISTRIIESTTVQCLQTCKILYKLHVSSNKIQVSLQVITCC